jgi:tRNA ligase
MRHEIIVQRFFDQHQPLDVATEAVDEVVELKVEDGLRENLQVVIGRLVELLPGLEKPSEQKVDEAMDWVKSYDPSVKKDVDGTPTTPPRYYALAPEIDVVKTVQKVFASSPTASPDALVEPKQFLDRLIGEQRITAKPHITLVHERNVQDELAQLNPLLPSTSSASSQSPSSPKIESTSILGPSLHLAASTAASEPTSSSASSPNPSSSPPQTGPISLTWSRCQSIASDPTRPLYSFRLTHLVWNARVMALVVSRLSPLSPSSPTLPLDDEEGMHLTVGTASADIPAVESRPLVRAFRRGEMSEGMGVLAFGGDGEFGKGRVKGLS